MNKPHLVAIVGNNMYRYSGGQRIEHVKVDPEAWEQHTLAERKALIEDFRANGLPAPEEQASVEAIHLTGHELLHKQALMGMELAELLALWKSTSDEQGYVAGGHRLESVWEELDRRGVRVPRG